MDDDETRDEIATAIPHDAGDHCRPEAPDELPAPFCVASMCEAYRMIGFHE